MYYKRENFKNCLCEALGNVFFSQTCVYELLFERDLVAIAVEVNKALCSSFYYAAENYGKLSRGRPERTIIDLLIDDTGVRKGELS